MKENSLKRKRNSNQSPSKKRSRTQSVSFRKKRWFKVAFTVTRLTRTTTPEPKIKRYITADDLIEAREYPSYQITLSFITQKIIIAQKLCKKNLKIKPYSVSNVPKSKFCVAKTTSIEAKSP